MRLPQDATRPRHARLVVHILSSLREIYCCLGGPACIKPVNATPASALLTTRAILGGALRLQKSNPSFPNHDPYRNARRHEIPLELMVNHWQHNQLGHLSLCRITRNEICGRVEIGDRENRLPLRRAHHSGQRGALRLRAVMPLWGCLL